MLLTATCYAKNAVIDIPIKFTIQDRTVTVGFVDREGEPYSVLRSSRKIELAEISLVGRAENDVIDALLSKCRHELNEAALVVEGIIAAHYMVSMPGFDVSRAYVTVSPENDSESKILASGDVLRGCGIMKDEPPKGYFFSWEKSYDGHVKGAEDNLPLLSLLSSALSAHERDEQEVAYFLYFRILESFFGDGTEHLERSFLANKDELCRYVGIDDEMRNAFSLILLDELKIKSTALDGTKDGAIKDMVLLRHKLAHYHPRHPEKHFHANMRQPLQVINRRMELGCYLLVREKVFGYRTEYDLTGAIESKKKLS